MKLRSNNINMRKPIKPISMMNHHMLKSLHKKRMLGQAGFPRGNKLKPTGGLALHLADNANKYSKMQMQIEA